MLAASEASPKGIQRLPASIPASDIALATAFMQGRW